MEEKEMETITLLDWTTLKLKQEKGKLRDSSLFDDFDKTIKLATNCKGLQEECLRLKQELRKIKDNKFSI